MNETTEEKTGWLNVTRRGSTGKWSDCGSFPLVDGTHAVKVDCENDTKGGNPWTETWEVQVSGTKVRVFDQDGDEWTDGFEESNCTDGKTWRL